MLEEGIVFVRLEERLLGWNDLTGSGLDCAGSILEMLTEPSISMQNTFRYEGMG